MPSRHRRGGGRIDCLAARRTAIARLAAGATPRGGSFAPRKAGSQNSRCEPCQYGPRGLASGAARATSGRVKPMSPCLRRPPDPGRACSGPHASASANARPAAPRGSAASRAIVERQVSNPPVSMTRASSAGFLRLAGDDRGWDLSEVFYSWCCPVPALATAAPPCTEVR
jgi:hypothetical protein